MSLMFAVEPLAECWKDVDRLGREHWGETEEYRHGQQYNPDWQRYFSSDAAGWYFMCTARAEGYMVGYGGMWTMPSMHTQRLVAMEDTFFILPAYRKGWNAIRFLKFIEAECRKRGAIEVGWTDKKGKGALLDRLGYERVGYQYSKQFLGADSTTTKPVVESVDVRTLCPASA